VHTGSCWNRHETLPPCDAESRSFCRSVARGVAQLTTVAGCRTWGSNGQGRSQTCPLRARAAQPRARC